MIKISKLVLILAASAVYSSALLAMPGGNGVVPRLTWADSYSVGGRCYIDSNFDHGIGSQVVSTPVGKQTVRQVAARLGRGPGRAGNPVYNDVQCGNGPANNAGDEDYNQCPGRVDRGAAGCSVIGPKWDLARAYGKPQSSPEPATPAQPSTPPAAGAACSAWGDDLARARRAFAEACPTARQRDCDPLRGRTLCASVPVETLAVIPADNQSATPPVTQPTAKPTAPKPVTPPPAVTQPVKPGPASACFVRKNSLGVATRAFATACPAAKFRDCDPLNGQWVCADTRVETLDKALFTGNPLAPVADPGNGNNGGGDGHVPVVAATDGQCYVVASSLQGARQAFTQQCRGKSVDCDPVNGLWVCANARVETINNLDTGSAATLTARQIPSAISTRPASSSVLDPSNLLSLHYDCAPDPDDGQASVAGKVLVDVFNIKPHVVVGAYGYQQRNAYNSGCEPIFDAAWLSGTALSSGYVNAFQDRSGAVDATARLWKRTVQNGGQVFVAEGGPSDFTHEVLLKLTSNERSRITVVQHANWNEEHTRPSSLNYVRNTTNYIRIADGNVSNSTADLNQKSSSFVTRALNSRWQNAWSAAFSFLDPGRRLDFSDTVELLYLLDVPTALVATPNDFADRYFR